MRLGALCNEAVFIFADKETQILRLKPGTRGQTRWNQVMISKIKPSSASSYLFIFEVVFTQHNSRRYIILILNNKCHILSQDEDVCLTRVVFRAKDMQTHQ